MLSAGLPSNSDIAKINDGITKINDYLLNLKNSTSNTNPTMTKILEDLANLQTVNSQGTPIAGYLYSYEVNHSKVESSMLSLQSKVASSDSTVTIDKSDLVGLLTLVKDSGEIASTTTDLLSNLNKLNIAITGQQQTLAASTADMYNGYSVLSKNLLVLTGGVSKLSGATGQLLQGSRQLSNGLATAYNGSLLLGSNLNKLSLNSTSLRNGSSQAATGAQKLASATSEISKQLSLQSTNDSTANQIVTPVESNESIIGNVPNYGYALAPYVLSLGLYVGAIVFCVIYPVRRSFSEHKNAVGWWLSKMSVASVVAVGQALVLDAIMYLFLGLHPNNCWQFISMSALTSITYMSLVLLLSIALDNVGRFIAMLILVLQLGSAEGVFPLVLSPKFFQVLNPFLPMTYSIRGFRQAISSGLGDAVYSKNALILICVTIVLNVILILFMKHRGSRQFSHKSIEA
jgi:putative membrane protein